MGAVYDAELSIHSDDERVTARSPGASRRSLGHVVEVAETQDGLCDINVTCALGLPTDYPSRLAVSSAHNYY